jgi:hypothetical protein
MEVGGRCQRQFASHSRARSLAGRAKADFPRFRCAADSPSRLPSRIRAISAPSVGKPEAER